ncbi:hypothetical protein BC629DRAFT_1175043 [Irpex lacteus]|nr:hypothetical protein BC629DRAFT_1175043 [Irpex lacteus]
MEISDTDSEVPPSSSGPTTNTTPARSLSPSTSKLSPLQPLKDEIATHKSSSTFSLKKMEALQAAQQGGERKVPATRKSDAAPSAQAKETEPGPSTKVSEAELDVVSATQKDDSVLERPTTSLGAQTKLVPFVQGSKTITELRPVVPLSPRNMDRPPRAAAAKTKQRPGEDIEVDEGVEVDIDGEEVAAAAGEDSDSDDSDYHGEDSDEPPFSDQELNLAADPEAEDEPEDDLTYLRLMPRSVLERILQRLLKPPQSQQTRKAVQSLIQENIPETLASYDTSLRIKINETHTAMIQEMQEEHSSLTSDDFAHAMARFLRNEVRVLHSFPGSGPATFEVILYLAEHSYGDLELDDRPGFDERASFDRAADRALLYVAEERLEEEGASFRAAIPGYLETLRSQAMYLYRHGRHPKTWFPASVAFLQSSLQPNNAKKCGRLRSATRNASPFRLQRIDS